MTAWKRCLEFCGYSDSYRALKVELAHASSNLSQREILAMPALIRGPSPTAPLEEKLAKWCR